MSLNLNRLEKVRHLANGSVEARSKLTSCTGEKLGFDTDEMTKCSEGDEGKKLLEASYAVSKNLGIGSSPTWLANNKFKFSGVDPETIKSNFCKYNKVAGCEKTLSGPPPRPAGNNAPAPGCGG